MRKIRKKIYFYKGLLIELIETLCTICLVLNSDINMRRYPQLHYSLDLHFKSLKQYIESLRGDL